MRCHIAGCAILLAGLGGEAVADEVYPRISGEIAVEIQNDWTFDSQDAANERNDLFTLTEPNVVVRLTPRSSFTAHGVLEVVRDPGPGEDRVFEDHGFFLEELHYDYTGDGFSLIVGKFAPNFGQAWYATPGVYGTDFAEAGYELAERIGFGGAYTVKSGTYGQHTVSASAFFLDTSILAESVFTGRGDIGRKDGGPSNTGKPNSFAVTLDGSFPALDGLAYHLAVVDQAKGTGNGKDETGVAFGLNYTFKLSEVDVNPYVEIVHFENAGAVRAQDRNFATAALGLGWRNWNLALAYARRETDPEAGGRTVNEQLQVSAGYAFDNGIGVDFGWRLLEEAGLSSHTFGILLGYRYDF